MHVWRTEEGVEGIGVCGCIPLCLLPMCGSFCWHAYVCALAGWTSPPCPAACAVTQPVPWRHACCFSLATPRLGQTSEDTRRERGANLSRAEEKRNRHTCTNACTCTPVWAHALNKPALCDKQAAHAFEQSCSIDAVACPLCLICWVNQDTAWVNYHLCMKLSGEEQVHTQCLDLCGWVCVCVRMSDTPLRLCLVFSFFKRLQNTDLSYYTAYST